MKILALYGDTDHKEVETMFPEGAEYTYLSIHEFAAQDVIKDSEYDIVVMLHSLMKLTSQLVPDTLKKVFGALKVGGEIWIYVPSYEWCAKQAFIENPSIMLHYELYGTEKSPNHSVFNLSWLRALVEQSGFTPRTATQNKYQLKSKDKQGKEMILAMVQNIVIGWKTNEKPVTARSDDPSTAID